MATACISLVHYDPPATAATGVELVVEHGHQKARVYIDLPPPLGSHTPTTEDLIPLIRDLGEALLRISDMPLSIDARHLTRR